jgi:flavin-binding protein dodecin
MGCAQTFPVSPPGLDSEAYCLNISLAAGALGARWFEALQIRGSIENDQIRPYQVTVKVGFTLEED